jgi:hypothetical protein
MKHIKIYFFVTAASVGLACSIFLASEKTEKQHLFLEKNNEHTANHISKISIKNTATTYNPEVTRESSLELRNESFLEFARKEISLGHFENIKQLLIKNLSDITTEEAVAYSIADILISYSNDMASLGIIKNELTKREVASKSNSEIDDHLSSRDKVDAYIINELFLSRNTTLVESFYNYAKDIGNSSQELAVGIAGYYAANGDFNKSIKLLESIENKSDETSATLANFYYANNNIKEAIILASQLRLKDSHVSSSLTNIPFEIS